MGHTILVIKCIDRVVNCQLFIGYIFVITGCRQDINNRVRVGGFV